MFCTVFLLLAFSYNAHCKEYKAVDELDLPTYMGKWYQVYKDNFNKVFQGFGRCSTAEYSILDTNKVSVLNQQMQPGNLAMLKPIPTYIAQGACFKNLIEELDLTSFDVCSATKMDFVMIL